jgi:4-hydroxybenzoate polyprenyltransferase
MVWSWVTVLVPGFEFTTLTSYQVSLLFLEKTLFIIGITIPFDIRDLEVDAHYKIDTLPLGFGLYRSKVFAIVSLCFAWLIALMLCTSSLYQLSQVLGLLVFYLFAICLVGYSQQHQHDYYFSGLLDGLILLQFITVYLCA